MGAGRKTAIYARVRTVDLAISDCERVLVD